MGFDKFLNKAKNLASNPKVRETLRGEKGQQFLDKAEGAARNATGGKHDDKIRKARGAADRAIGRDEGDDGRSGNRTPRA